MDMTQIANISYFSGVIERILSTYGTRELTNVEFCEALGFQGEDLNRVKMFWNPTFNKSMFYLSDEIILDMLTEERGKDATNNFAKRKLIKKYIVGEDYVEIDKNHPLVIEYYNQYHSKMQHGNRKRYFAVTGECFKYLLMESVKGKTMRKYYVKVEEAAGLMHQYLCEINKQRAKLYSDAIFEFMRNIKQFDAHNQPVAGHVYIASTNKYMKDNIYKIGSTIDICQRLSSLNTSHDVDDSLVVLKSYQTLFHREKELLIHRMLDSYRNSTRREFFTIEYTKLIEIMDDILLHKCIG